jgi:hypothetical protein
VRKSWDKWIQAGASGFILAFATWWLFGPVSGFHHSYGFGVFAYMAWDGGGGYDPTAFRFWGFEVSFSPIRFGVSVLVWLLTAVVALAPLVATFRRHQTRPWHRWFP